MFKSGRRWWNRPWLKFHKIGELILSSWANVICPFVKLVGKAIQSNKILTRCRVNDQLISQSSDEMKLYSYSYRNCLLQLESKSIHWIRLASLWVWLPSNPSTLIKIEDRNKKLVITLHYVTHFYIVSQTSLNLAALVVVFSLHMKKLFSHGGLVELHSLVNLITLSQLWCI